MNLKLCPFCGGEMKVENWPWINGEPCYELTHVDFNAAVKAKCPLEMSGYDSVEELEKAWNRREE